MFEAILMSTNLLRGRKVREALVETGQVEVNRVLDSVPTSYEIIRLLNVSQPDLFVVDLDDGEGAAATVQSVRTRSRSTAIIAFGDEFSGTQETADLLGVEAVLPYPVDVPAMMAAIDRAIHDKKGDTIDNLYAFLPAKAGCGTSTIVLNTAARLVNSLGKKVLVFEADLRSGVLGIMLGVEHHGGIQRILELAGQLDTFQWENNITRAHGVDFMLTRRESGGAIPGWHNYHQVLNFARPKYEMMLVDLPELVNPATVEIVRRAAATFIVCTPEVAPLNLAKMRCEELTLWGAAPTRIHLLLNRSQRGEMSAEEVKKFTGFDVAAVFPNDYKNLREAMNAGAPLSAKAALGQAALEFAGQLAGVEVAQPDSGGLFGRFFR